MILAIDYGQKRIGLAAGEKIPHGFGVIDNLGEYDVAKKLILICKETEAREVVLGLPENRDKQSQHNIGKIKNIGTSLEKAGLKVNYEPEEFTSVEAERILKGKGRYDRNHKEKVDEMAAVLLLEQYLNKINNQG